MQALPATDILRDWFAQYEEEFATHSKGGGDVSTSLLRSSGPTSPNYRARMWQNASLRNQSVPATPIGSARVSGSVRFATTAVAEAAAGPSERLLPGTDAFPNSTAEDTMPRRMAPLQVAKRSTLVSPTRASHEATLRVRSIVAKLQQTKNEERLWLDAQLEVRKQREEELHRKQRERKLPRRQLTPEMRGGGNHRKAPLPQQIFGGLVDDRLGVLPIERCHTNEDLEPLAPFVDSL